MRLMSVGRALCALLFVLALPPLEAQDLQVDVSESRGTAEIQISGGDWFQAVTGRSVPAGARLATWIGARTGFVLVESDDRALVSIGELSVMDLENATERLVFRLIVGSASVDAEGVDLVVHVGDHTITTTNATFELTPDAILVSRGQVFLEIGGSRTLEAGESALLNVDRPRPLLGSLD